MEFNRLQLVMSSVMMMMMIYCKEMVYFLQHETSQMAIVKISNIQIFHTLTELSQIVQRSTLKSLTQFFFNIFSMMLHHPLIFKHTA